MHGRRWWPLIPMLFVTPVVTFVAQPAMGFSLMERVVYDQMAELDQRHWWYRARREVLDALIRRVARPPAGRARSSRSAAAPAITSPCSAHSARVDALELDDEARDIAEQRLGKPVMSAPLPELDGVAERHYDLVGAFDVIEHIDDDRAAMASIARRLKPGGKFVMTVPAHQWMWSAHDVANHHQRRYSKAALRRLVEGIAASARARSAISTACCSRWRWPSAWRRSCAARTTPTSSLPPAAAQCRARKIFAPNAHLVGRLPLPPGLSLFAVASAI